MIDLSKKPVVLKNLLNYLGQDPETEIIYEYYGYGVFNHRKVCKIKDLPREVSHYGKCFEITCNMEHAIYKVDGAL